MRIVSSILFLLFLCTEFLRAGHEDLLDKSFAERYPLLSDFYQSVPHRQDSSMARQVRNVRELAKKHKDDDLLMEAEIMRLYYYYYLPGTSSGELLGMMDSVREKAVRQKRVWAEAMVENMIAVYHFYRLKNYEAGFEHHERVYQLIKDLAPSEYPEKGISLYQIGHEHYYFSDYRPCIFYLEQASRAGTGSREDFSMSILNTLGLCYQKLGDLDSSNLYFQTIIRNAQITGDSLWGAIAESNFGHNLFLSGQYEQAKPYLENSIRVSTRNGDYESVAGSWLLLAKIALAQKDFAAAEKFVSESRKYVFLSDKGNFRESLYTLLSKLYAVSGNAAQSMIYLDSALFVKDSLARQYNLLQMTRAKQKVEMERHRAELNEIEEEKKDKVIQRNVLIALLLSLVIIGWLLINFLRQRHRRQQEMQQAQLKEAEQELRFYTRQMADFTRNISEKNALIETMQARLGATSASALEELQQSIILTEEDWENFKKLFEQLHPGFFAALLSQYPDLTKGEVRFLALCKLHIDTKEMAAMLGIGVEGVRKQRHRVRKKLEKLYPGTELEDFIREI